MNQFTEVYRGKSRSRYRRSRRHEREVAEALISKDRQRFRRWAVRLALAAAALSAVGYFLLTASLTVILIAGGLLLALLAALVVFGLYVLENVR